MKTESRRSIRAGASLLWVMSLLLIAACSGNQAASSNNTLKLGYSGRSIEASMFPLWLPEALGYWEDAGLTVEVDGFPGNTELLQALVVGEVDVTSASTGPLLDAVAQEQPVKAVYNVYTKSMFGLAVSADSDIQTLEDIRGKVIGVSALTDGQVPQIKAQLAEVGISEDEYELAAVGRGQEAYSFHESGRVDVLGLWDAQFYILEQLGMELRRIEAPQMEKTGFGYVESVRTEDIEPRRDELVGFLRGIAQAREFAAANPEAAARLYFEMFPESMPAGKSEAEAVEQEAGQITERLKITEPRDGVSGLETEEKIDEYIDILHTAGVLKTKVSASDAFTDELLDEVNDFDKEAIREEARNR